MVKLSEHDGKHYAITYFYDPNGEAWNVELSEAVPAPASWAEIPDAPTHMGGPSFLDGIVPDEDPSRAPSIRFGDTEREVPYEIMTWFMEQVAAQVADCRAAFETRE